VPSPPARDAAGRPAAGWQVKALATVIAVELVVGVTGAAVLPGRSEARPGRPVAGVPTTPAPSASPTTGAYVPVTDERTAAVTALLAARGKAVRARDKAAFLATVDPGATAYRARQGKVFDALRQVPLSGWDYALDTAREQAADPTLDRRYRTSWWAPDVSLRYSLTDYDTVPTVEPQHLTFVLRSGRWLVAADDDFAARGARTTRDLWDGGRVVVVRGARTLVLGHPGSEATMRRLAGEVDAAVPRVSAVWGAWSRRVVLLVPDSQRELGGLIGSTKDLSQIAAVAMAEIPAGEDGYHPVGDRVIVNPSSFAELGPLGRRVVLTHEVTHVASRSATGPLTPTWLIEGLADHVGYLSVDLPLSVTAAELRRDVRAGRLPSALPTEKAFSADATRLSQAYEQAWLAVGLLVQRYGRARTLAFYKDVGAARSGTSAAAVDGAMRRHFGTSLRAFTASWRGSLRARLS
jgi:hypothetical protein